MAGKQTRQKAAKVEVQAEPPTTLDPAQILKVELRADVAQWVLNVLKLKIDPTDLMDAHMAFREAVLTAVKALPQKVTAEQIADGIEG